MQDLEHILAFPARTQGVTGVGQAVQVKAVADPDPIEQEQEGP